MCLLTLQRWQCAKVQQTSFKVALSMNLSAPRKMETPPQGKTAFIVICIAATAVLLAGWGGARLLSRHAPAEKRWVGSMLLAPMIAVADPCIMQPQQPITTGDARIDALAQSCTGPDGSAAQLVESTLSTLQPRASVATSPQPLGYTLAAPLLQLFRQEGGTWAIDTERVQRIARTIRDTSRPVILYLFATHFATDAPLEAELASDSKNLAQTRDGPMAQGRYYDSAINNWSLASTATDLTARRVQATQALLSELCRLPVADLAKIKGVTLLGELHHMFPDFEAGMGFDRPYRVTDYGPHSTAGFQQFLKQEFTSIAQLNRVLGSEYRSFAEVLPPGRDIRTEPLQRYTEHIDSFAHGTLPVSGWVFSDTPKRGAYPAWVHVYVDGIFMGKTPVEQGRQDVLEAKPEFGFANTGWRMDLDFRTLAPGLHRIDVFVENAPGQISLMGTRQIAVMDRQQKTPVLHPQKPLPAHAQLSTSVQFHIDQPVEKASYYYNPLVPLWHAFRGQQVTEYLGFFDQVINASCLKAAPHYTHQIIPFTNPSWDANKFAIQTSLQKQRSDGLKLGVSLYGHASYGAGFHKWYASTGHRSYGVTEFHPLKPMSAEELRQTLDRHERQGADFLSFFIEPYWQGRVVARSHNLFSFDPENRKFGANKLYEAMQQHLAQPR